MPTSDRSSERDPDLPASVQAASPTAPAPSGPGSLAPPVTAGVVTAVVGYSSSFAVVLAGLQAAGATPAQASSGLMALSAAVGLASIALALRFRQPITLAWSTPGAALLASSGAADGGWPAAVGAFAVAGLLLALSGAVPALGTLVARIPGPIAQAMLAGILVPLCTAPFEALAASPLVVGPVVAVWLAATRFAPRWAVPAALVAAIAAIGVSIAAGGGAPDPALLVPSLEVTAPTLTLGSAIGIALPLYIVTMASQNVPGAAVLASFGYQAPWRASLLATGAATAVAAPFGGHAVNLAAISAALAAGEEAGPDRSRRWVAALTSGAVYLGLAAGSAALGALVAAGPEGVLETVAGLALLATLASSITAALSDERERGGAAVTFVLAASGLSVAGIGAAFWALAGGLAVRAVLRWGR